MSANEQQALETIAPNAEGLSASSSSDPGKVTQTIRRAIATGHYLGAATSCSEMPPGCAVAFSAVKIDALRETYPIPGSNKLGISKTGLNRISKAIGISWDSRLSHRVDKGEDSFLAVYKAVGRYRDFDGTFRTIEAEKQMDLREGSESARSMKPGELAVQRKFIAEHAQTKAQLRAIRSGIGIETAYAKEFFDEPLICARLIFTGHSENPETQRIFDTEVARMMMGGVDALYGSVPREITPPAKIEPAALNAGEPETTTDAGAASQEQAKEEPPSTECTPAKCLKIGSTKHVPECFGETSAKAAPEQTTLPVEPKMDAIDRALSGQLDVVVNALDHAEGKSEVEIEALLKQKVQIIAAIEERRK